MKEQHCYLIKPEKTVMANKKTASAVQKQTECVTSSVSRNRASTLDGDRQEGKLRGLAQKRSCCRPACSVSSPGHPTITAIQQSWNMSPGSSGRSAICGKQLLPCLQALQKPNQPTHTHTQTPSPNLPVHPTLFSIFSNYKSKGVRHYNTCTFRLSKLKVDMLS